MDYSYSTLHIIISCSTLATTQPFWFMIRRADSCTCGLWTVWQSIIWWGCPLYLTNSMLRVKVAGGLPPTIERDHEQTYYDWSFTRSFSFHTHCACRKKCQLHSHIVAVPGLETYMLLVCISVNIQLTPWQCADLVFIYIICIYTHQSYLNTWQAYTNNI